MAKIVRMVAEIDPERCTGCKLCTFVCPTVALRMEGRLAVIDPTACYNAQNCLEICPDDAIVMRHLDEPFVVGVDPTEADPEAVAALCLSAGLMPEMRVCFCTETTAEELAAAILLGADSPERLSLATGARTGCTEICQQPFLRMLDVAGHGEVPPDPPRGFQRYGLTGRLFDLMDESLQLPDELVDDYPQYPLRKDLHALLGNLEEA